MKMKRRTFLQGAGSLVAAASVSSIALGKEHKPSVGVVGGGILGASIAMHLTQAGARVTLFEKKAPASGATSKSFAWINAYTADPHYRALRLKSIAAWHALDQQLPLRVGWGGCIHWAENIAEAERLKAEMTEFDLTGYPAQMITADDLADMAPNVSFGPIHAAAINSMDAHIDPVHVTQAFLKQAESSGAEIVHPCEVKELQFSGEKLKGVATTTGNYALDRLVIAGGVDTPPLAAQAGYAPKLKHAPGILLHTNAIGPTLDHVFESPQMYFKQMQSGRIVGNDGSYAPDIPEHAGILHGPMDMPDEIRTLHGERILNTFREKIRNLENARYDHLTLGYRPMPEDGLPVAGFSPGNSDVYIAVMHSGVTLAPIMGRYITHELVNDAPIDELAPYRPGR